MDDERLVLLRQESDADCGHDQFAWRGSSNRAFSAGPIRIAQEFKRGPLGAKMKHGFKYLLAVSMAVLFAGTVVVAQTKKKSTIKYYRINANQTFHVRIGKSLKSGESRIGDTFSTTVVDPVYS